MMVDVYSISKHLFNLGEFEMINRKEGMAVNWHKIGMDLYLTWRVKCVIIVS